MDKKKEKKNNIKDKKEAEKIKANGKKNGNKKHKGSFAKPFLITLNVFLVIILGIFAFGYFDLRYNISGRSIIVWEKIKENITNDTNSNQNNNHNNLTGIDSDKVIFVPPSGDVDSYYLTENGPCTYDYIDSMVFLGDSRVVAMETLGHIRSDNTFAEVGISLSAFRNKAFFYPAYGYDMKITKILAHKKPKIVYIALGVNGVGYVDNEDFIKDYNGLIDDILEVSPDSKIIIQSILPVGSAEEEKLPKLNNDNIDAVNLLLMKLAFERNLYYLDVASVMKQADNTLAEEYDDGGGLHFTSRTYDVIMNYIKNHPIPGYSMN